MSSLSSYGRGDEKTFRPIHLDDPQRPDTAYGQSKLEAENYIRKQTYFPYVILRPTGVYGPGEKDYFMEIQSVKSGLDFAVGAIPQRITFIYVKDLATVAFLSLEKEEIENRHYFVADGDVYTDESFARMIQDILGKKRVLHARIPLGLVRIACHCSEWIGKLLKKSMTLNSDKYIILKQRNWICDVTPLQDDLGFIPAYPLRKGLEESIEWYKRKGGCKNHSTFSILPVAHYLFLDILGISFVFYGTATGYLCLDFVYDKGFYVSTTGNLALKLIHGTIESTYCTATGDRELSCAYGSP